MMSMIPDHWRAAYEDWLAGARPALDAHDWKKAYADYPRIELTAPPFTRLTKPLSACRVALISSCGLSLPQQAPFDAGHVLGDPSFRVITDRGPLKAWAIHHDHYDNAAAREDYNTVFPLDALFDLAAQGKIGWLSPRNFSFMGYLPDPEPFLRESVPEMIGMMREDEVDAALLVPV